MKRLDEGTAVSDHIGIFQAFEKTFEFVEKDKTGCIHGGKGPMKSPDPGGTEQFRLF